MNNLPLVSRTADADFDRWAEELGEARWYQSQLNTYLAGFAAGASAVRRIHPDPEPAKAAA